MSTLVLPQLNATGRRQVQQPVDGQTIRLEQLAELVTIAEDSQRQRTIRAPFTGDVLGSVPMCVEADVAAAIKRARVAQRIWARRTFRERRNIFSRYHDLILERQAGLLDLLQLENGKARWHAQEEVMDVAMTSRHYAYHGPAYLKPRRRPGALPLVTSTWEYHHPVGVVGIISPWNYPLALAISDAIPALIAGNSVILKPAEETPLVALYALQLLREAGLPYEVFQVVTGQGSVIGPALIREVDFVGFTGSTATGRVVAKQAAERLINYSMELGGKNPALIFDDANLDRAVEGMIRGSFSNAGQLCIAFERIYVQRGLYHRFVEAFVQRVKQLTLNANLDFSADMGCLVSPQQLDKVTEHVQDAVDKGATVLAGGTARPDLGPYFYEPTVLINVTPDMALYAEETFGPVVAIYPFDTVEEAIGLANDTRYGLNASIWSRNIRRARRIAQRIEAGMVNINEAYAATWGSIGAPMGGMKESGVGRRHGAQGILKYTESQTVSAQRLFPLAPFGILKPVHVAVILTLFLLIIKRIPGLR